MAQRQVPPPSESDSSHFPLKRILLGVIQKNELWGKIKSILIHRTFQIPWPQEDEFIATLPFPFSPPPLVCCPASYFKNMNVFTVFSFKEKITHFQQLSLLITETSHLLGCSRSLESYPLLPHKLPSGATQPSSLLILYVFVTDALGRKICFNHCLRINFPFVHQHSPINLTFW